MSPAEREACLTSHRSKLRVKCGGGGGGHNYHYSMYPLDQPGRLAPSTLCGDSAARAQCASSCLPVTHLSYPVPRVPSPRMDYLGTPAVSTSIVLGALFRCIEINFFSPSPFFIYLILISHLRSLFSSVFRVQMPNDSPAYRVLYHVTPVYRVHLR